MLVPEDRRQQGLFMPASIDRNIAVTVLEKIRRLGLIRRRDERKVADEWSKRLQLKHQGLGKPVDRLSGGNQQKVVLAKWLAEQPGIQTAYTQKQLLGEIPANDEIGRRVQKSFLPDRSGDVLIVAKPFHFILIQKTGTTHGSPHPYDTHVPLIVFGPGVKPGQRGDAVTPQAMAASLARALGVAAPARAEAPVPDKLFE